MNPTSAALKMFSAKPPPFAETDSTMRMIRHRQHSNIVVSPKTNTAIPAPTPIHRDLLIQSVLDPHVRSIEFVHQVVHGRQTVDAKSVVLHRDDGHYLIEVVGARPHRDTEEEEALELGLRARGIQRLEMDPDDIRREPRFGNARRIWEHRNYHPAVRDRERIMDALYERGPQRIYELEDVVRASSDATSIVCSLACEDAVELDIDSMALGPDTIVRNRR